MNAPGSPLFREEALRYRVDRLHGNVSIATPLAWQAIGFLLLSALVTSVVFLSSASYSRVAIVPGAVTLDKGVATVVPTRAGLVQNIMVSEGDRVRSGQRLTVIRAEENMIAGASAPELIRDALNRQDTELADQRRLLLRASIADQERLKAQIDGNVAAISTLASQISDQKELIVAAETDYRNAKEVAARGYISKRDMDQRQATILTRHQQLSQLMQTIADKRAEIAQAQRAIAQSAMSAQAQAANAQSNREALVQAQAQTDLSRGYALTSPVDGIVTALTARLGQPVNSGQQLMMIIPANSKPRVELYVPTTAAGFLAAGQEVQLSIDAFPHQTFGTVKARVLSVSQAAMPRQTPNGSVPEYLVVASIPEPWIMAFGKKQVLLPGMTLSGRIITEKRSLIAWLFEPLFAVRKR